MKSAANVIVSGPLYQRLGSGLRYAKHAGSQPHLLPMQAGRTHRGYKTVVCYAVNAYSR